MLIYSQSVDEYLCDYTYSVIDSVIMLIAQVRSGFKGSEVWVIVHSSLSSKGLITG